MNPLITFLFFILAMLMIVVSAWNLDFHNNTFIRVGKHKISFWKASTWTFFVLAIVFFSLTLYLFGQEKEERITEVIKEEAAWVLAKCPVYKSECGSKHKYACEQKASAVGRNHVGEIFVEAYATCGAK